MLRASGVGDLTGIGGVAGLVQVRRVVGSASVWPAANKSLVVTTGDLRVFGPFVVGDMGSIGESHGGYPLPHSSALAAHG